MRCIWICTGTDWEGNDTPLQYSCLENPMDRGAWKAAVHGVGRWGSDTIEWLHFPFSLSCIREGNGNPLQCSCLENLGDRGAWWVTVYGVAQSRTRLKWLSSSSSSMMSLRSIQSHCKWQHFLLPHLNDIPLSECVCVYTYIYHIFFILSSVDGHLHCFHSCETGCHF